MTLKTREKPSVLLLHGLGGTGDTLAPLARCIEARGIAVAHPTLAEQARRSASCGVGTLSNLSLNGLLDEAREHARRLAIRDTRPIICGHSNGALLAHTLAAEGAASGVFLMAPVPPPSVPTEIPAWLQALFFSASFGRRWRSGALHFERTRRFDRDPPSGQVANTLLPDSGRVLAEALRLAPGCPFDPEPPLDVPVAVAAAERDKIVPTKTARKIAEHFGASFHLIAGTGHWFPAECQFSDHLADLIARLAEAIRSVETEDCAA